MSAVLAPACGGSGSEGKGGAGGATSTTSQGGSAGSGGGSTTSSSSSSSSSSTGSGACTPPCMPDNDCQTSTCMEGQCVAGNVAAGKLPAGLQIDGDCRVRTCDGAGNVVVEDDPADTVDDANECTEDVCQAGQPTSTPLPSGTACTQNGGKKCDGSGECVACVADADCGAGGVCQPGNVCAQPATFWVTTFEGSNSATQALARVRVGAAGAVTAYGDFDQTVDLGGGPIAASSSDIYLAKLDTSGNHLWSKRFGGTGVERAKDMILDSAGNAVVAVEVSSSTDLGMGPLAAMGGYDIGLAKYDASGNPVWTKLYGAAGDQTANGLAVDAASNVFVGGEFQGTFHLGGAPSITATGSNKDAFVAKLDASGSQLWAKSFGFAAPNESVKSVAVDASGNVFAFGTYGGGATSLGGSQLPAPITGNAFFLMKLDGNGNHLWSQAFRPSNGVALDGQVAVDGAGSVYLSGTASGDLSFRGGSKNCSPSAATTGGFVAKLSTLGTILWRECYPSTTGSSAVRSIALDAADNPLLLGSFDGTVNFGAGFVASTAGAGTQGTIFLLKLDAGGTHIAHETYDYGLPSSIARDPLGPVILGGTYSSGFNGGLDLGTGPLPTPSLVDTFLAKVSAP